MFVINDQRYTPTMCICSRFEDFIELCEIGFEDIHVFIKLPTHKSIYIY